MWQIKIVNAKVHARHGLYPEEKILGQNFIVNICIDFDSKKIESLSQTIDYVTVYEIMLQEMQATKPLLEQVIEAIANRLNKDIKLMQGLYISIQKCNPLFAKQVQATEVTYNWKK